MANAIKRSGEGLALQITREARAADLATTVADGEATGADRWARLAAVRVYGFDGLLLVVDRERAAAEHVAELVASAAGDTASIYRGANASVRPAGNGCMVSLPGLEETGLELGQTVPARPAPNLLVIHARESRPARVAEDLATIRRGQVEKSGAGG